MRLRESTRIGLAILAALAGSVGSVVLPAMLPQAFNAPAEAVAFLLLLTPVTFCMLLLLFGFLLVGPYKSPAQQRAASKPPPMPRVSGMPASTCPASPAPAARRNSVTRASSWRP
jgi:hypothetical protein